MRNVLILQHAEGEWIGSMEHWFAQVKFTLTTIRLDLNEPLPTSTDDIDWLIIMGGPMSVYNEAEYPWLVAEKAFIADAIRQHKKVLGICLGGQLIANALGAEVCANQQLEIGWFAIQKASNHQTAGNHQTDIAPWLPDEFTPLNWHGDRFHVPEGAESIASSALTPSQGFVYQERVVGLQYHLEAQAGTAATCLHLHEAHEGSLPAAPSVQAKPDLLAKTHLPHSQQVMFSLLDYLQQLPD